MSNRRGKAWGLELAAEAFQITSRYDTAIAKYFQSVVN